MAEVILMPRLSDTMTEGVIAAWHKNVGDAVKKGDLLAEIETDKATMELESYQEGTLLHIGTAVGGKLQVNDLLAIIGNAADDVNALINSAAAAPINNTIETVIDAPTPAAQVAEVTANTAALDYATMEEIVLMPRLSDTMTEGVIAGWNKNVGDTVKKGDILADIETDKATMELESYKDGILLYQGAKAGEKILVNDLLAVIGKPDFDVAAAVQGLKGGANNTNVPAATPVAAAETLPIAKADATDTVSATVVNEGRILASPLAKKIASEKGIDLKYVPGTGDNGRIVRSDVEGFVPATKAVDKQVASTQAAPAQESTQPKEVKTVAPPTVIAGVESYEEVPVSQMRKVIAKRLSESLFTAPHFFLTMAINMDAAVEARTRINELGAAKISFNDMVLKATAVALKQHPKVNSSWLGDKIRINNHVNIGVAVAVEDGLLVPVVRFADAKSLSQINAEVKEYAKKAKDKKLQPADWEGSTFTISNLGMFGIDQFTAIINPPDACILAVGGISQEPIVKNGAIVPGNIMKVTLSCDHRVVDGATGSAFLQTLKGLLEEPLRMLL